MSRFTVHPTFSVKDLAAAKDFYTKTLGFEVQVDNSPEMLVLQAGSGTRFVVYQKADHKPADHTVIGLEVKGIQDVVKDLKSKGVTIEPVEGTNDEGIATQGPVSCAWFKDPAGNWFCLNEGL